jgi:hypothetical protein
MIIFLKEQNNRIKKLTIMKKKVFYSIAAWALTGMFVFTSCDNIKENDFNLNDLDVELAEDDAIAEDVYNTVDAMIDDEVANLDANAYSSLTGLKSAIDNDPYVCKVISIDHPDDTTRFPKVITIDYGEGCTLEINGEQYTRRGVIQITVTNRWFLEGAQRTTTFIDFYVNDVKVEGTRTVTNNGTNESGNLVFSHRLQNGKLVFNDSLEYTRTSNGTREWVRAGSPLDDVWYIIGEREGTNAHGFTYRHEITNRLMMVRCEAFRYQWMIVEGKIEVTRNDKAGTIDYGNGTCDDTAILTIDGEQREIKVRKRYHNRRRFFANNNN